MTKCEYCGEEREKVITSFGVIGYYQCKCEESQRRIKQQQDEELKRDREKRIKEFRSKIEAANIPERYFTARKVVDAKLLAELYEMAFNGGLYLYGSTGTGKTTMACAIGISAIQTGNQVRFIKAYQIPDMFRTYQDADYVIERPDLLIIDDLGSDATNEWANTRLRAAIDARYDSMKPTIITSNYSKKELTQQLTNGTDDMTPRAILSRLSEMTKSYELGGEDRRK